MTESRRYLDLAARLAQRGRGDVEPNPMVGCVIVREGRVLGVGHHRRFGGLHAERDALESCRRMGHEARGATVYCTLEPCNAQGKQPACVDALIEAGVARVVYALADPNPAKAGGAARLSRAGIACELSGASANASACAAAWAKRVATGLPWVIAKWAQTIDGRIATRTGESQWISGARSRARVHRLRAQVDAVIVGVGTVMADDPMLTARGVRRVRRVARRVVVDSLLRMPMEAKLVRTAREVPTVVCCVGAAVGDVATRAAALRGAGVHVWECGAAKGVKEDVGRGVDLREVLRRLTAESDAATVLVESGPRMLGSLVEADLVDEARVYVAPMVLGDAEARGAAEGLCVPGLAGVRRMKLWRTRAIGDDVELVYRRGV
jgi:diaminohydroxyphosphoribosylaminopyrimidine deaminase / 5-amino-6-(5-phosphoribosylamino)uracil reductase